MYPNLHIGHSQLPLSRAPCNSFLLSDRNLAPRNSTTAQSSFRIEQAFLRDIPRHRCRCRNNRFYRPAYSCFRWQSWKHIDSSHLLIPVRSIGRNLPGEFFHSKHPPRHRNSLPRWNNTTVHHLTGTLADLKSKHRNTCYNQNRPSRNLRIA